MNDPSAFHSPSVKQGQQESASLASTFPLSFAQQRLWFLNQVAPESAFYNVPVAVHLCGKLDVDVLRRSVNEIVRRHEILRTRFPEIKGQPVQAVDPDFVLALPVEDFRLDAGTDFQEAIKKKAVEAAREPFDLTQGPLVRGSILRVGADDHVLLLVMHHIITDGWSMSVFYRELATLYAAFIAGKPSPLPELPIQYVDFAVWQRERLRENRLETLLAYWKQSLKGASALLELPTDYARPKIQSFEGCTQSRALSKELCTALKQLCQQEGVTVFMALLAAFKVLLYRYTGQEDIVVGTPVANRDQGEIEGLIGFFVNTLVMRTQLSTHVTFRELLHCVRKTALEAYVHQELPFEKLVEELQPERNLSYNPLFQVVFVLQNTPELAVEIPRLRMAPLPVDNGASKFDLTLSIEEKEAELIAMLEYSTALFDPQTITRMLDHLENVLQGVAADPDQPVSKLPLLTEAERQQMLVEWNDTSTAWPQAGCLHERFEAQVARAPNDVAVTFGDEQMTYRGLNERANRLAHYLRSLGVGPQVPVGLYLERSFDTVVAILGVLKAGGAYVPIDSAYPEERINYMLDDTQVAVLLTQTELLEKAALRAKQIVCLDRDWARIEQESSADLAVQVMPENHAYVIYTSGSTGKPKGTPISHYNVTRLFDATQKWFHFDAQDVWTLFHTCAFDFSVWELWGALLYGGRLVVVPYIVSRSPEAFYDLVHRERVTVLNQTPSAFRQLIWVEDKRGVKDLSLRLVIFGGEALELNSLKPWYDHHGDRHPQLVNMYGITETAVHVTYRPLTRADVETQSGSVIGRPLPDLQVYILDQALQPTPIGVPGEIHVGGAGLSSGYLGRPSLTAERFIPNPFNEQPGTRLYKSGDLGRYRPDGDIEYLGRIDHQVKIRGFRIELGEIESVLTQHLTVRECVVLPRHDGTRATYLAAYVVSDQAIGSREMRDFLKQKLPEYMVPAVFVMLDAMPLTTNGKIDRRALPAPDMSRLESGSTRVAPGNPVEEVLAGIWAKVLGGKPLGIRDNFFDLGGHSLLVTQVVSLTRDVFRVNLPLRTLFENPTISEFAQAVVAHESKPGQTEKIARLMKKIENMPIEEARKLLQRRSKQ